MSSIDLAARAGITYRQLDHWTRLGYLTADGQPPGLTGSGNGREFRPDEARRLLLLARLVAVGVKPSKAAQYARSMVADDQRWIILPGGITITIGL